MRIVLCGLLAATLLGSCHEPPPPPRAADANSTAPAPSAVGSGVGSAPNPASSAIAKTVTTNAADAGATAAASGVCPQDMVLAEGKYCPHPAHVCLRWLDGQGPFHEYRCGEYAQPAKCAEPDDKRVAKRFCIDREEYVAPGETLPLVNQSWTSSKEVCEKDGKRLCLESEWQFACEGEEIRPYPYGFKRDATLCNIDRMDLGKPQEGLRDLRAPISAYPKCLSPFGVHNMSGNSEEWSTLDQGKAPERSSMKGAWWLPGKNHCRAATLGHGETYRGKQVGVRCCKDAG